ncbi:MAG TPA: class I SAM-dependent DNA methyltransferase [Pirellulales bacterium]|jgi:type I restriction enzyme M protein|nr:class I SAM-dependent DNA methyltransferase [Pirellulales bacterium]
MMGKSKQKQTAAKAKPAKSAPRPKTKPKVLTTKQQRKARPETNGKVVPLSATRAPLDMPALESWLWDAACVVRGAMDAPKFKDYILPLIFIKRLSDVYEDELARLAESLGDVDTAADMAEQDHGLVRFYIPREATWPELRKLTRDIGQRLTDAARSIADENESLQGVIDIVDFNATVSGERIIADEKLSALIEVISRHRIGLADAEPDLLGRAYEYLLRKFAEGQGQSAGEFYTPREVGMILAHILNPEPGQTAYDPACGSAGLLVKLQIVCRDNHDMVATEKPLQLFGQEQSPVTFAMARMNMAIHDMNGDIVIGDTLRSPKLLEGSSLKQFDLVVANPMWNQKGYDPKFYDEDPFGRFTFGYPTGNTADWGWVQHMFASLADRGRAGVVLDTGAVSRGSGSVSSDKERDIRKEFVDRDLVEGVVLLPENLFYNTPSPGVLLFLNKSKPSKRRGRIMLINASGDFTKGKPKNYISDTAIRRIADTFLKWKDVDKYSQVITIDTAKASDYSLSPSRYIDLGEQVDHRPIGTIAQDLEHAQQIAAQLVGELDTILRELRLVTGTTNDC